MKRLICLVLGLIFCSGAWAIDVSPSEKKVPEKFVNPGGKRFSIFAGDPERVQKANEVNIKDFEGSVDIPAKDFSLADWRLSKEKNTFDVVFHIKNKGKRSYILSFPDAQRYDVLIKNSKNEPIYVWSSDKVFVKAIGQAFINKNESFSFRPSPEIEIKQFVEKLFPGEYKVIAHLSNYPEIKGETTFRVKP